MTVLVCLSNFLLCEALQELMSREPTDWNIIAVNNPQAAACVKPDVVLVDFANLDQDLFSAWPDAKFLLLDTGMPPHEIVNLMRLYRLDGILSTDTDFQLFKRALQVIRNGQMWVDHTKMKDLLRCDAAGSGSATVERLTDREKQIAEKIVEGFRNKEIAEKLFLSERTVKSHINRIFRKLELTSRSQLVSLFMKNSSPDR